MSECGCVSFAIPPRKDAVWRSAATVMRDPHRFSERARITMELHHLEYFIELSKFQNVSLTAEYGFRKTWTDYLDDVSTTYVGSEVLLAGVQDGVLAAALADRSEVPNAVGIKRGDDSLDDWYSYFNLSLGMNLDMLFGWMRSKRCRN